MFKMITVRKLRNLFKTLNNLISNEINEKIMLIMVLLLK